MPEVKILIVENEGIIAMEIQDRLQRMGYTVSAVVASGEVAVEKAAEIRPDLVLMDIRLKGEMDGVEAAEQIRARFDIPVVYLTAYADEVTLQRAKVTEPFGYVLKPFEERELVLNIEMALYKHDVDKRLRESEARYRAVSELTSDLAYAFRVEPEGTLVREWVTEAFDRVTGFTSEEMVVRGGWASVIHPDDISASQRHIQRLLSGQPHTYELRIVTKSGEVRWLRDCGQPVWDAAEGRVVRIYGAAQDITERKRTERDLRQRERFLSSLNDITRAALETPDLQSMLQILADRLGELFGADGCYLTLWDEATQMPIPGAAYGEWREVYPSVCVEPGEVTMTESVLRAGHPLVAEDVSGTPYLSQRIAELFPDRSLLGLPLIAGDRKLGAALIAFYELHHFTPGEIVLGEQAAGQIALALAKARLLEEAQTRWHEAETLRQAGAALTETLSLDETLVRILEQLEQVVPYNSASIQLLREGHMEIVSGRGFPELEAVVGLKFPVPGDNPNTVVVESRQPFVLTDAPAAHAPFREPPHSHINSWLGVPLIVRDRVIGMLAVDSVDRGYFDQTHVRLVIPFANQAAIAIENARLVEGLEAEVRARTAEIVAEREKSETILRSVADAIVMMNLDTQIQYVNDAFTALTGYMAKDVLGQLLSLLIDEAMPGQARQSLSLAIDKGEPWQGEVIVRRKDGRTYDAALTIASMRDAESHLVGYVSSHRDITRLRMLDQARRQFMTNVSHELRTPVSNIKLFAQLLLMGKRPERADHYLQVLVEQADRLAALVQDILVVTEFDSGQMPMSWEPVPLPTVVADTVTRFQNRANVAALSLAAKSMPPDVPVVMGDLARLTQALNELVENAVIFTEPGGQVTIEVGTTEMDGRHWVMIAVRDTGPGILPEDQERVFERFFRGQLASSGHIPGTGLGLSIAEEIMRAHGGRLTVESQLGEGSIFTLWLPGEVRT